MFTYNDTVMRSSPTHSRTLTLNLRDFRALRCHWMKLHIYYQCDRERKKKKKEGGSFDDDADPFTFSSKGDEPPRVKRRKEITEGVCPAVRT